MVPCVRLFPFLGRFIATDLLTHDDSDQVFSLMFEQVYFVRNMSARPGDRVLEVGLGSGVNSLFAADRAHQVTGVDINERALAFARFNEALCPGAEERAVLTNLLMEALPGHRIEIHCLDLQPIEHHIEGFKSKKGYEMWRERLATTGLTHVQFLFVRTEPSEAPETTLLTPREAIAGAHELADRWLL